MTQQVTLLDYATELERLAKEADDFTKPDEKACVLLGADDFRKLAAILRGCNTRIEAAEAMQEALKWGGRVADAIAAGQAFRATSIPL